jgi:hypothetical protein
MANESYPPGAAHGQPRNLGQPPLGAQEGLGTSDPLNLLGGSSPRSSPAPRPNPRIQPAARDADRRRRGPA